MDSTEDTASVAPSAHEIRKQLARTRQELTEKLSELSTRILEPASTRARKDRTMATTKKASGSSASRTRKSASRSSASRSTSTRSKSNGSKSSSASSSKGRSRSRSPSILTTAKRMVEKVATRAASSAVAGALKGVAEEVLGNNKKSKSSPSRGKKK